MYLIDLSQGLQARLSDHPCTVRHGKGIMWLKDGLLLVFVLLLDTNSPHPVTPETAPPQLLSPLLLLLLLLLLLPPPPSPPPLLLLLLLLVLLLDTRAPPAGGRLPQNIRCPVHRHTAASVRLPGLWENAWQESDRHLVQWLRGYTHQPGAA